MVKIPLALKNTQDLTVGIMYTTELSPFSSMANLLSDLSLDQNQNRINVISFS